MANAKLLDKVLKFFYVGNKPHNSTHVSNYFHGEKDDIDRDVLEIVLRKIHKDGYLHYNPVQSTYQITYEGLTFFESGGYDHERRLKKLASSRQAAKRYIEHKQIESVIDTNNSSIATNTAIQNNIPVQKRQTNISIAIGAISLLFIATTVWQTCHDTTPKELQGIQKEINQLTQSIQGLQQRLEKIYPDPKKIEKDSTNK